MQRKSARAASESKRCNIPGRPSSPERHYRRVPNSADALPLVPPENAQIFVYLSPKSQLDQMPKQTLGTYLVSRVGVIVESGADIVISDRRVHEIRSNSSFQVIEDKLTSRNHLQRKRMRPGGHGRAQQAPCHEF